jgi:ubiquinone/menaquinone biosynthesis C-methylase UbiE
MTVADIGAGTGWLTVAVARRVGQSGRVEMLWSLLTY